MANTLLLADSSVTIQRVIELTFAEEDISVVAVSDGNDAIASLDQTPPDIVLADIGMPGTSGYDIARHMKRTPGLAHIPVLLLTGVFEPVDPAIVAEIGCDGVLTKPFEPQLVIRRVKELLRRTVPAAMAVEPPIDSQPLSEPVQGLDRPTQPAFTDVPVVEEAVPAPVVERHDEPPVAIPRPRSDTDVESYFEELDQAFASLVADRGPTTVFSRPVGAPSAPTLPEVPRASLADAFTALLAAERASPGVAGAPLPPLSVAAEPPLSTDDLVERVTRRALERLSAESVRAMIERIVSDTAERLIREEIERIKSNII